MRALLAILGAALATGVASQPFVRELHWLEVGVKGGRRAAAVPRAPLPRPPLPGPLPGLPLPGLPPLPARVRGPLYPAGALLPHHPLSGKPVLRPFVPLACPPIPLRPSDNEHCKWTGLHDVRGCLIRYKCEPLEPPPKPCPPSPRRPDLGNSCNWIPIQDKRGCIIDYECEPLTPPPCPAPPEKPPVSPVCRWVAIKDKKNCITSYSCEPSSQVEAKQWPCQCPVNPAYMLNDCAQACRSPVCIAKAGFLKSHK